MSIYHVTVSSGRQPAFLLQSYSKEITLLVQIKKRNRLLFHGCRRIWVSGLQLIVSSPPRTQSTGAVTAYQKILHAILLYGLIIEARMCIISQHGFKCVTVAYNKYRNFPKDELFYGCQITLDEAAWQKVIGARKHGW